MNPEKGNSGTMVGLAGERERRIRRRGGGTTFSLNVNQPPCGLGGLLHEHLRLAFWPLLGDAPPGALQRKTVLCFGKRYLALVRPLKFPL